MKRLSDKEKIKANFFVGIEAGMIKLSLKWMMLSVVCIADSKGRIGFGTPPLFEIPEIVSKKALKRVELGKIIDEITGENNTKQKKGAINFFTKGKITRKDLYISGLTCALIPFLNEKIYFKK